MRSLLAFRHDDKVLVEEFLDGIEVEVGVLGNREPDRVASRARSCRCGHEWYDYASKYDEGGMDLVIPPDLPDERARAGAASSRSSRFASPSARAWPASTASSSDGDRSSSTS